MILEHQLPVPGCICPECSPESFEEIVLYAFEDVECDLSGMFEDVLMDLATPGSEFSEDILAAMDDQWPWEDDLE